MYSCSSNEKRPDWNSDHRRTLGNFLVYRNTQFSASHLLSPLWIGAHLDGEAEAHILRKVSLTYILNEATPGCTSWGKLQGRVLGSVAASNSGRELIMNPITDWTARDQSNKMRLSYLLFLITSRTNCVRFRTLSEVVGAAKHALLLTSAFPSEAVIRPFKENTARFQRDLSVHVFCPERWQSERKVFVG